MSKELVQRVRDKLYPGVGALNDRVKAFQITKHVAYQLRDQGFGLVEAKPGSDNNAEGFTNDIIAKKDGYHVDILQDGEGAATATWQPNTNPEHNAAVKTRWKPPFDVGDIFAEEKENEEENENGGETVNEALVNVLLHIVENQQKQIEATNNLVAEVRKGINELKAEINKGIPVRLGR